MRKQMMNRYLALFAIVILLANPVNVFAQREPIQGDNPQVGLTEGVFSAEELKEGILFEDIIKRLPLKERKEMCNSLFADGIYVDIPECWDCVDNPPNVLAAVMAQNEPLSVNMLGALERIFPGLVSHTERMQAGILLYRYGRLIGYTYLEKRVVGRLDIEAARVLAGEKNAELLPHVLKILKKYHDPRLAFVLSHWQYPLVEAALKEEAQLSFKEKKAGWLLTVEAAARIGVPEAAAMLRDVYKTLPADDSNKLEVAALLLKLQPKNRELITYLLQQQNLPNDKLPYSEWRYEVVKAMGMSKHPQFAGRLEAVVKDYLAKGDITVYQTEGGLRRSELAITALEGLEEIGADSVPKLAIELLRKLEKGSSRGDYWVRIARIIMKRDFEGTRPLLESIMGKQWYSGELIVRKLKAVDPNYLPRNKFDPSQRFYDPDVIPAKPPRPIVDKH